MGVGIEIAQCIDFGIEQFHSQGVLLVQGINVDDPSANAELAWAGNHPFTGIAHCDQFLRQAVQIQLHANGKIKAMRFPDRSWREDFLETGGRNHDDPFFAALQKIQGFNPLAAVFG
ncbi:hypothetical protein SDC9_117223 [bioreactor metagenome]|uniref:Uncharacterized protein n=1 Tax=bioreactor metagenome TaxID=1076179 RepID=A0A645BY17_9ZZZZ